MKNTSFITIGKIGSTYGVHGWIKIQSYAEFADNIFDYHPWYLTDPSGKQQTIEIEAWKPHSDGLIAKFIGIETPEEARLLTGKTIQIARETLPELNQHEYYWSDLIGLTVINKAGDILGKVDHLMETGSNDVLVVKGTKEHAIPYLFGRVVLRVDLEKKEIQVDWEPL